MKIFDSMDNMDLSDFVENLNKTLGLDIKYYPIDDTLGGGTESEVSIFQEVKDFAIFVKDKIEKKYQKK